MIGVPHHSLKIYVALGACNMRKSFNGLHDIVCHQFDDTRLTREALFAFYRIESWMHNDTATSDCRLLVRRV